MCVSRWLVHQAVLQSQEGEQGRFSSEVKRLQQRIEESQREFDERAQSSATVISNLEAKLVRGRQRQSCGAGVF